MASSSSAVGGGRAVQHENGQGGLMGGGAAAFHTQGLHGVAAVADAGGIRQPKQYTAHGELFLHRVTGRAGDVGDDGPVIAQQGVEQGGLTGVGLAQQHGGYALLQQLPPGEAGQQSLQILTGGVKRVQQLRLPEVLDVLVGIVHHGVEPGGHGQEGIVDAVHGAAQRTGELADGVVGLLRCFGVDEIRHRLGLQQVQLTAEEGALGKLAALGLTAAGGEQGAEAGVQHHRAAVTVQLGAVLAGVAVGRGEGDAQHVIDDAARPIQQVAQHHGPGTLCGGGSAVPGAEHRVQRGKGIRTGEPEDTDGAGAAAGGNGGDGVRHGNGLLG